MQKKPLQIHRKREKRERSNALSVTYNTQKHDNEWIFKRMNAHQYER